jgi:ATP-dependent helicase Lhr and Lhr-like helicase
MQTLDTPLDPALSGFLPVVARWFSEELGAPTPPQQQGWPAIRAGRHVLVAAPTGTGKTLAAFLWAIDGLLRQGPALLDETQVLYVSPLRALSNDVQKNLQRPLDALVARDPSLPAVRVLVRTGDTSASSRAAMTRKPPHVLVTTPESLYILLTSDGGRRMLSTVRTVIVDEIHALARDKRGSHLALSLERLSHLCGEGLQRIGLSATQKPLEAVANLLVGAGRDCERVDIGHLRELDLDVLLPDTPLSSVCSHEQWGELYRKMAEAIRAHRTTLIFVGTRKLAERLSARLSEHLGAERVGCHHGSLSRETREQAERRLKAGELSVLVATASLELGLDIGDVDLVLQVGNARSIATLLQRVGRAGHGVTRIPKGRLVPLTVDEAVEAVALLAAVQDGQLDRTPQPPAALDILAQQIVAACVPQEWSEDELFAALRRAWPYRELTRADFDACVALHAGGRIALLHRDGVGGRLRATRRARMPAITSGGAIPDNADYRVLLEPEGTFVGTLNEDFAIEANARDIFQLGNASWQIVKVEPGVVRVVDARGQPPTLPFWLGEAPARTAELSALIGEVREGIAGALDESADDPPRGELPGPIAGAADWLRARTAVARGPGVPLELAVQLVTHVAEGVAALGAVPTQRRVILERFFDESGGQQLVVHAPFGGRINRAWGLALRKCFCRGFGFELQAAANEEAIVISLGPHHSFPLADAAKFLHPNSARELLVQALLAAPAFTTRWRWNVVRSLLLPRLRDGRPVPPALQRMRADDLLVSAFPQCMACPETLPAGDTPVPDHPVVRQTVDDCLHEAMDVDGFLAVLRGLHDGSIEVRAVDTPAPSSFAHGILSAAPWAFLDDAPLEERRVQAVQRRHALPAADDALGDLDPDAIELVRAQAFPDPQGMEELHEALLWMGFLSDAEARERGWRTWLDELVRAGRASALAAPEGPRWFATEAPREPKEVLRGRLEALGPIGDDDALAQEFREALLQLEAEGAVLRTRLAGRPAWCIRRLLARIHKLTLERLRAEIEPVSASDCLRFLAEWQRVAGEPRPSGPRAVLDVVRQLAGWQAPAAQWEARLLPARVPGYRKAWLDELSLSGELAWGRLWGAGVLPIRNAPVTLFPREDADAWLGLATPGDVWSVKGPGRVVLETLGQRGPSFQQELLRATRLLPAQLEQGLADLIGLGLATCDAFSGLRALYGGRRVHGERARRGAPPAPAGRWAVFRGAALPTAPGAEFVARQLLRRTGVVFRRSIERERLPVPWGQVLRALRTLEARGEVRGGRFVAGFPGEQYALPEAVPRLREARRRGGDVPAAVGPGDPWDALREALVTEFKPARPERVAD